VVINEKPLNIPAAVFKAECLKLMDEVARTGRVLVITKHGKPVAQLTPVPADSASLFGYMKSTVTIEGDIVSATDVTWHALSGVENHLFDAPPHSSQGRQSRRSLGVRAASSIST
jgi:prevent-host-death family protein